MVQADGKILAGGFFSRLGGGHTGTTIRHRIGRLHADGSLDISFDPGANDGVFVLLETDGRILVGGQFTTLGGGGMGTTPRHRLGRLRRPVSGRDFNGDSTSDIAVYRSSTGMWNIRNQSAVQFGGPGQVPVAGDYDGDGTTDFAVYQPSSGVWDIRNQSAVQFGQPGDIPTPGDYDGDGTTDLAVYRLFDGWMVRAQPTGDQRVRRSRLHSRGL